MMRARWQIERLFDLWKQHGHLDKTRSEKPLRVLCEVSTRSCWVYSSNTGSSLVAEVGGGRIEAW
ncbi:MAG: transposase [Rubrobacteraceae bacterium]|nr:transposase [Rubrobacteraceae bacterium]